MHVAALSGLRLEEACGLTIGQCEGGVFDIRSGKTDAARRKVPLHPDLAPVVAFRCAGKEPSALLFPEAGEPDRYGKRGVNMSARFYKLRLKNGVDERAPGAKVSRINFHSFRRWFITRAVEAEQPPHVLRQVVGHKPPKDDVTMGVYSKAQLVAAKAACVAAVQLPAEVRAMLAVPPLPSRGG